MDTNQKINIKIFCSIAHYF